LVGQVAAVFGQGVDDLAKGQHASEFATVHHSQGANVQARHRFNGIAQQGIWRNGEQGAALDPKNIADLHGDGSAVVVVS
jgi:hypothetical protein